LPGSRIGEIFYPGVKLMIEPAEETAQPPGAGLAPMLLEVHAMAKVRVQEVTESEIAFESLDEIKPGAAAEPIEQVTEGRHEVVNDKQKGQRTNG
jgi:hypothetical protein